MSSDPGDRAPGPRLFRAAALEEYRRGEEEGGALLRNAPGWTRWTYWLLVAGTLGFVLFALFGRVNEYAAGPAVVRMGDRVEVAATAAGVVRRIAVAPGQAVARGEALVLFQGDQELAESRRLRALFDARMRRYLQDPDDPAASAAVIQARRELELAETRLGELALRAPRDGTVGDVWVEAGEHVTPGRPVLSLGTGAGGDGGEVVALLPGRFRPLLAPGQPLRLEVQGYPYRYQSLVVESVNDQVLGPAEARQALGPTLRDALPVTGPVVVVRARLPRPSFELAGRTVLYHDGMPGYAEVPVRSEPIFASLLPGLDEAPWRRDG